MTKDIEKICKHYGKTQLDIAQEELAELIQAISKYKRYGGMQQTIYSIEEEIADVEVMLQQVIWVVGCDRKIIDEIKEEKVQRQLERIKNEL